jgi:hypothetical protein
MASIERRGEIGWFARQLDKRTEEMHLINQGDNFVHGLIPTASGPSDIILEKYNDRDASMRLHVAPEPAGSLEQIVNYQNRENEFASTLYDRRLDHIGGHVYYGQDFPLTSDIEHNKRIIGETAFKLSEELPYVRWNHLEITSGMRAKDQSYGRGISER